MAFCVPVKKEKTKTWKILESVVGVGMYGSVRLACKRVNNNCSYVLKVIPLTTTFTKRKFLREVKAQKILASKGFSLDVEDFWVCENKPTGVIVMRVLDMTAEKFLENKDTTVDDHIALIQTIYNLIHDLHDSGYYHGDTHLGNIMLKKVNTEEPYTFTSTIGRFRVYLIDMGKTGSLAGHHRFLSIQDKKNLDINVLTGEFMTYARNAFLQGEFLENQDEDRVSRNK